MSQVRCHPFEVPHGQRPAVLEILRAHGLFPSHREILDPDLTYTARDVDGENLFEDIRRHAPGTAVRVWTKAAGDKPGILNAYAPGMGTCSVACCDDGRPFLDPADVVGLIRDAAAGQAVPPGHHVDAVERAAGIPWTERASRSRDQFRDGLLAVCGTCARTVTGMPAACADGCVQAEGHGGLCLRPSGPTCQWCGAEGRLHEVPFDRASRVLPRVLYQGPHAWMLVSPALSAGPYQTGGEAWAAWQSGLTAVLPGAGRGKAALDAAVCHVTGVFGTGESGTTSYEVWADLPGAYPNLRLRVSAGHDGEITAVTGPAVGVIGALRDKAAAAVHAFRAETRYQERVDAIRDAVEQYGGQHGQWRAELRDGSGMPDDRECEFLLSRADGSWSQVAIVSPADLLRIVPDVAVTDTSNHSAARRASEICDYLDRAGRTQCASGPTLRRRDRVEDPRTLHADLGTVIDIWCERGDDGNWAEQARVAFHLDPAGSTVVIPAAALRPVSRLADSPPVPYTAPAATAAASARRDRRLGGRELPAQHGR